jgi:hypothetical protein
MQWSFLSLHYKMAAGNQGHHIFSVHVTSLDRNSFLSSQIKMKFYTELYLGVFNVYIKFHIDISVIFENIFNFVVKNNSESSRL